jgi:Uma2 family endonuclease
MAAPPSANDSPYRDWFPRWPVAKYQRMIEVGIFSAEERVELIDGYIVVIDPEGSSHDATIDRVKTALASLPGDWWVRVRQPVVLAESQVEPDLAVVRANPRGYETLYPAGQETGLVIEVADSSLLRDQRDKTRIYARAGIPVYWIINLVDRRVEVYTQPSGPTAVPAYGAFQTYQPGDVVPLVLDGVTVGSVAANDLLPGP